MTKVDPAAALALLTRNLGAFRPDPATVSRPHYRREPYVRVQIPNAGTLDAKAVAWTQTMVLIHWADTRTVHEVWVPATAVTRMPRRDSTWQDPYDDYDWYAADGQL